MASSSSSLVRSWRTAFLTLRDETLTCPPRTPISSLLHRLIFSQTDTLIAAAPNLPPSEVASDMMFLLEQAHNTLIPLGNDDMGETFTSLCHLLHYVSHNVSFEINSSSWAFMLDSLRKMVDIFGDKAGTKRVFLEDGIIRAINQCLKTLRSLICRHHRKCSLSENTQLLSFLLSIAASFPAELSFSSYLSGNKTYSAEFGKRMPRYSMVFEVQTTAFTMIGEIFSRIGSSISADIWQSTIEVIKGVTDVLASKSMLVEDNVMARFYSSLLQCLHLVIADPKGSISDYVAGFVAALRMFFTYGLMKISQMHPIAGHKKELSSKSLGLSLVGSSKLDCGVYRPPHLRKKNYPNVQQPKTHKSPSCSDSMVDYMSSDSDCSDSDGSTKDANNICSSKVRVAAIVCLQDLCRADPKSFTAQWTMLLPSSDVLQPRKYEATLITCLLFDPYLKARMASASTLSAMLDGPAHVFLQVAEYKETSKCGSFTSLSSSLGQILMQLHTGILYLIKNENHSGLLVSLFKILMLLISSTPYSRMPGELLPTVILFLRARIEEGFLLKYDQTGLQAAAFNCLTLALSSSPSSLEVREMFVAELSGDFVRAEETSSVLSTLFRFSEAGTSPAICFEALQALRAVSHNYPDIMVLCWERVSNLVSGFLRLASPEVSTRPWKGNVGNTIGSMMEKVVTAAVKVLDECLRAISGFKGTEDLLDDKLLDTPFTSDCTRMKKISSAPLYECESLVVTEDGPQASQSGSEQWCETIEKHMPLVLHHISAMVRAASVTCFAGITSSVFFSLSNEKQDFIITSSIRAAINDEVPSVRSAACRAIGVITCFPQISESAEILNKFIHAAEINAHDPLISVRITASWALANVCDSLRHCTNVFISERCSVDSKGFSRSIASVIGCALQLTKDGDKVKANAVRALGNLSRCVQFTHHSRFHEKLVDATCLSQTTKCAGEFPADNDSKDRLQMQVLQMQVASNSFHLASAEDSNWLEKMVQAFLSCVTTGNVKVQWNVCHALRNLFLNKTIELRDMDWAPSVFSILLLLLRDSSNYKIRIQAAAALAVPETVLDYGRSFSDVLQGMEHILENLSPNQISTPSNFKYRVALEKQLTSTMLHVLGLASRRDDPLVKEFLVKKASFLEEWFKMLCLSAEQTGSQLETDNNSRGSQKKVVITKAMQSLIEVYEGSNHRAIARRFDKLANSMG